jgi:hypothetical protein
MVHPDILHRHTLGLNTLKRLRVLWTCSRGSGWVCAWRGTNMAVLVPYSRSWGMQKVQSNSLGNGCIDV